MNPMLPTGIQREHADFVIRALGTRHLLGTALLTYLRQALGGAEGGTVQLNLAEEQAEEIMNALVTLFIEIGLQDSEPNAVGLRIEDLIDAFNLYQSGS